MYGPPEGGSSVMVRGGGGGGDPNMPMAVYERAEPCGGADGEEARVRLRIARGNVWQSPKGVMTRV